MRLLKNAQPAIEPKDQTVHNYGPNYVGLVFAAFVVIILAVLGLWYSLVYVLARVGFTNGEQALSRAVVFIILGSILITLLKIGFDNWVNYRLQMADKDIEKLEVLHRLQTSVVDDTRETAPDLKRRNALIVALMVDALNGDNNLSYRKAGQYTLTGETQPVGKGSVVVQQALQWLTDNGAIDNNKLTGKYTSISQVQRALYNPPTITK